MLRLFRTRFISTLLAAVALSPAIASGQGADTRAPDVIEAERFRETGQLREAVELLRRHRAQYPNDGDAIRLLSQTLYWLKDFQSARALYDSAVALHPEDVTLRLQYARMLMETGDSPRAREIIAPLVAGPSPDPRATTLLGTMAYWEGDFTIAERLFRRALAADASDADARRQLAEIRATAAPWICVAAGALHDDQPLDRFGGDIEAGYFLTPLVSVKARTGSDRFSDDSTNLTTAGGSIGLNGFFPASRTDIALEAGFIQRTGPSSRSDWTGVAALGIRPSSFTRLEVRGERAAYLYTAASLRIPVMVEAVGASFGLDRNGWLGQAAYQLQRFPDDNTITGAHVWGMAPIARGTGTLLQGGYSGSYSDAQELRFVRNSSGTPVQGDAFPGHYEPYYTPSNILTHSVIAAFTGNNGRGLVARLGGSYGVHATEDAPMFTSFVGRPSGTPVIESRTFHPWAARASIEQRLSGGGVISARVEHFKTAFYNATTGGVEITWRLASR